LEPLWLPEAAFSIFAARSSALLLVRGAILGAWTTGFCLGDSVAGSLGLAACEDGRAPATDAGRVVIAGRWLGAWTAAEVFEREGGLFKDEVELLREMPAGLPVRNMNEEGGAASFCALNAADLFSLGATTGALTDATDIVSLRLCPGTPSNVSLAAAPLVLLPKLKIVGLCLAGVGAGCWPSLNAAARVIRGATAGGAVDATAIVSARL